MGAWKSVWLKHYPAYPVIIISLIIQRNLATKIQAKQESSLTAVQLKWNPPVVNEQMNVTKVVVQAAAEAAQAVVQSMTLIRAETAQGTQNAGPKISRPVMKQPTFNLEW